MHAFYETFSFEANELFLGGKRSSSWNIFELRSYVMHTAREHRHYRQNKSRHEQKLSSCRALLFIFMLSVDNIRDSIKHCY